MTLDPALARRVWSPRQLRARLAADEAGGAGAGSPMVRKFPFAFDTPGLLAGYSFFTPTPDDILLDLWIEITTVWDGTTPLGDVGSPGFGHAAIPGVGFFAYTWPAAPEGAIDMTNATASVGAFSPHMVVLNQGADLLHLDNAGFAYDTLQVPAIPSVPSSQQNLSHLRATNSAPVLPGRFIDATPLAVAVSQNGECSGPDPGSTQGVAVIYLVTVTPA